MSKYMAICLGMMLSVSAYAEDASKQFAELMLSIETLSGEFTQQILDNEGALLQETQGSFKVKRPGYFLWDIAPPYEQTVIGTPTSLKVYDPDLEQMTIHAKDSLAGSPALLISGDVEAIAAGYYVSVDTQRTAETFSLTPKNADAGAFVSLRFSFVRGGKKARLSQMIFADRLGQKTQIDVTKLKMNKGIAEAHFDFEPPTGTDIIIDG